MHGGGALLTAEQVGGALGIDVSTVYRMATDGRLRAVKVGRQWRFPAGAVQDLVSPRDVGPGSSQPDDPTLDLVAAHAAVTVAADLLGVMMVVTDMAGQPLTDVTNPCARFVEHADDPDLVQACATEWRTLASELDFAPRFRLGVLDFECARSFIRAGDRLVGMVLAGGVAPEGTVHEDLYTLDGPARAAVLGALPRVAAALSSAAPHPAGRSPKEHRS